MLSKKHLTKEQALQKIKHYCSYQERCHSEVKERLYSFGLRKHETEELVANLIENNYLNEERFAIQFAGGKFRMKHWGKRKIQYELQQKGVGKYIIQAALQQIPAENYWQTLQTIGTKKWDQLVGENLLSRLGKTNTYLVQKGFETNLVNQLLSDLRTQPNTKS